MNPIIGTQAQMSKKPFHVHLHPLIQAEVSGLNPTWRTRVQGASTESSANTKHIVISTAQKGHTTGQPNNIFLINIRTPEKESLFRCPVILCVVLNSLFLFYLAITHTERETDRETQQNPVYPVYQKSARPASFRDPASRVPPPLS